MEGGRKSNGWLNFPWKESWEREDGRELTGWLNFFPKTTWVREDGRTSTGWLNSFLKVKWVIEWEIVYFLIEFYSKLNMDKRRRDSQLIG